ncbi:MAG: energy transducer TonB [Candidatus Omnitrophica bacterium]|nr:energy transducer TonB [Candidatus Omnitrophota bacterium]
MMESSNRNLLRIFLVCLGAHILILPVLSLVLPAKVEKPPYYLVYLYQEAKTNISNAYLTKASPDLPSTRIIEKQKIDISMQKVGRIEKEISIGIQKTPLLTAEKLDNVNWELPVPRITETTPQTTEGRPEMETLPNIKVEGEEFEISGPGGTRPVISKTIPEYPFWAEQQSIESNVRIKIWVNKDGFVSATDIVETSGYRKLDIIAEEAIKKWRFAKIDKDINVWAIVTLKFRLK